MTYRETLNYMFAHLPMYQRVGAAAYKKDLTNTIAFCAHLGNPQEALKCIHVAGTNGKGSVSHFIAAMLQAAGFKVGLYVSPHYVDFRERIKINGRHIPHKKVSSFIEQHRAFIDELQPSFFEMTVGLAFDHFKEQNVDFAVIETGLGGRLDSTNIIKPLVSVITNISFDHMAMLGNTLPLIAAEKAGIIKQNTPVVIGEYQEEVWPVFEQKAREMSAPISCAQHEWRAMIDSDSAIYYSVFDIFHPASAGAFPQIPRILQLQLDVAGPYQSRNLCTALEAIHVLNETYPEFQKEKPYITQTHIRKGLGNVRAMTKFMGRWQMIGQKPDIICDSAHNEAGLTYLFDYLKQLDYRSVHIVCGFANDKDLGGILPLFPKQAKYYFAKANVPRGLAADELHSTAQTYGLKGKPYGSVRRALAAAMLSARPDDLILVTGSIFVLGEVLK